MTFLDEFMLITSRTNETVKQTRALREKKYRDAAGLHFIEGDKLVCEALHSGAAVKTVFCREGAACPALCEGATRVDVTAAVMEALCVGDAPQSLCATVQTPLLAPPAAYEGLLLVLEHLQDPGNVGTAIRSADAFGAAGVLLSPDTADPFSPKALRSSMGSVYHLPIYCAPLERELKKMRANGYTCLCGHLHGSEVLPPYTKKTALVVGNEGQGVTENTAELCYTYRLPMPGRAESLNAGVFASVMLFALSSANRGG